MLRDELLKLRTECHTPFGAMHFIRGRSVRHRRAVTCHLVNITGFMDSIARWHRCDFISYPTLKLRLVSLLCCAEMIFAIFTARSVVGSRGASGAASPGSGVQGRQNGEKINI